MRRQYLVDVFNITCSSLFFRRFSPSSTEPLHPMFSFLKLKKEFGWSHLSNLEFRILVNGVTINLVVKMYITFFHFDLISVKLISFLCTVSRISAPVIKDLTLKVLYYYYYHHHHHQHHHHHHHYYYYSPAKSHEP